MDVKTFGIYCILLGSSGLVNAMNFDDHLMIPPSWHRWRNQDYKFLKYYKQRPGWNYAVDYHDNYPSMEYNTLDQAKKPYIKLESSKPIIKMPMLKYGERFNFMKPSPAGNDISKQAADDVKDPSYNSNSNVLKNENIAEVFGTSPSDNEITIESNTDLDVSPQELNLHLQRSQTSRTPEDSSRSISDIASTDIIFHPQTTSQTLKETTDEANEISIQPDEEISTENSQDIDSRDASITQTIEKATGEDEFESNSTLPTTENSPGDETNESSSTGSHDETSFADNKSKQTDETSVSEGTKKLTASETNSDNSVSYSSTTTDIIQTKVTTTSNLESSSAGIEMQSTINSVSFTDFTTDLHTPSSTMEDTKASLTTVTEETTFSNPDSTESVSSVSKYVTEAVTEDHVIRISSIHTARMIVSVVFIVIALVAASVLAIYMFRLKRKAVQYDQLMLIP